MLKVDNTIVESCVHLTRYQSHALNLVMSIESSNVEQRTPKGVEAYFVRGVRMKVPHRLI